MPRYRQVLIPCTIEKKGASLRLERYNARPMRVWTIAPIEPMESRSRSEVMKHRRRTTETVAELTGNRDVEDSRNPWRTWLKLFNIRIPLVAFSVVHGDRTSLRPENPA